MRPAVFLDRDGVIIANRADYVRTWADVEFLAGAREAVARLAQTDMAVVIVSNQAAIGRGILSLYNAWHLHHRLVAELTAGGARIDASYLCPHHPDDGCRCRKPAPGMLLQAACELNLDLRSSWLVGDAESDLAAAAAAGVQGILVLTGRGKDQLETMPPPLRQRWPVADNLSSALNHILRVKARNAA